MPFYYHRVHSRENVFDIEGFAEVDEYNPKIIHSYFTGLICQVEKHCNMIVQCGSALRYFWRGEET